MKSTNKSGFKGVSWHKASKKWRAQSCINGVKIELGCFKNVEIASAVYQNFTKNNYGEFYSEGR